MTLKRVMKSFVLQSLSVLSSVLLKTSLILLKFAVAVPFPIHAHRPQTVS